MIPVLPVHFAPLQGYTDAVYRKFHARLYAGVAVYYTPFVRLENGQLRNRDIRDADPVNQGGVEVVPQLIAALPDEFRTIVSRLSEWGYRKIDINLGCPFPLLTKKHKGAGLLAYRDEAERLLRTVLEFPQIRFSVKMRLGQNSSDEGMALLPVLNDLPLSQITVHARVGIQQYKGTPDETGFACFYEGCRHSLFYNGDLLTPDDLRAVSASYPRLAGVMVGRGLLCNPALAEEYGQDCQLSEEEYKGRLSELHESVYSAYSAVLQGDHQLLMKMQSFWEYPALAFGHKAAKRIRKAARIDGYREAVKRLFDESLPER